MRAIKFRALKDDMSACIFVYGSLVYDNSGIPRITNDGGYLYTTCLKGSEQQFTGLLDKNGLTEIYENDIITKDGNIGGNINENPALLKDETNLVIQGFCSEEWEKTNKKAMDRGCKYAK